MLNEQISDREKADKVEAFMELKSIPDVEKMFGDNDEIFGANNELAELIDWLNRMGVGDYCVFDPSIVRGLAYYTGIAYEIYDKAGELRAIGGGGRYDDLLKQFGGPDIPATGFGIGDCVLELLLREKGLLDKQLPGRQIDYFVASVGNITFDDEKGNVKSTPEDEAIRLVAKLRSVGLSAVFSYKAVSLSKQLSEASAQNAKKCIIIGEEFNNNQLVVKDMATGQQKTIEVDKFFAELKPLVSAKAEP
jgi:histidyl-tRNA synthetase